MSTTSLEPTMPGRSDGEWPFVSVVVPIRNEAAWIGRCLRSLLAQEYPRERLEILVADGRSTDGTDAAVEAVSRIDARVRLLVNHRRIVPTGLNLAIGAARGEIIARVDGHSEVAPDYVRRVVTHLDRGVDAVGGPIETVGDGVLATAIAAGMSSAFGVGNAAFRTVPNRTLLVDTVAFPAYRRQVLEQLGPFDEELVRNQDDEFNYRLRRAGGRILLAHDVRARYAGRSSLRGLWRQYAQYGYWKVRVLQKHPRQMCLRQFVPPVFVATLVTAIVLGLVGQWWWPLALLLGSYGAFIALASWRMAVASWRVRALLPIVLITIHVAYGAGFLVGLVRFARRWSERAPDVPMLVAPRPGR